MTEILMAVYNGENYLAEQIESIIGQTRDDWRLILQDDRSSDGSLAVAQRYAREYPDRIEARQNEQPSGSAQANFFSLLSRANSEYIMTADQDDVWLPDKLERSLGLMGELERQYGKGRPLLVHSDVRVVDAGLRPVASSLYRLQGIDPRRTQLRQLLAQNTVTGCTMLCNRALLGLLGEAPEHALMHDWWLGLLASAFGEIGYLEEPTVLYRQHGENQVGAKDVRSWGYLRDRLRQPAAQRETLYATSRQAKELLERYGDRLSGGQRELLEAFGGLPGQGKMESWRTLVKYGTWKSGLLRKMGQLIYI